VNLPLRNASFCCERLQHRNAQRATSHQSLKGATPSSRYRPSPRPYPTILPPIDYPSHFAVKDITAAGTFRLGDRLYFLSNALRHYPVGLEEVDDGLWSIFFCHVLLARIDERAGTLTRG